MKLTYEIKELENQSMQICVSSENLKNATEKEKLTAFTIKSLVDILLKKLEEGNPDDLQEKLNNL
jgi:hypothetical protein